MAYIELFSGLRNGQIESQHPGYLLTMDNAGSTGYTVFCVTSFDHVREIFPDDTGVALRSDGYKMYMIHEPITYPRKYEEPYLREADEQIPLRLSELEAVEVEKQCRFLVSAHPVLSSGSLTHIKKRSASVALYFAERDAGSDALLEFIGRELHTTYNIPKRQVEQIQALIRKNLAQIQDGQLP